MMHACKMKYWMLCLFLGFALCGYAAIGESGSVDSLTGTRSGDGGVSSRLGNNVHPVSEHPVPDRARINNVVAEGWAVIQKGNIGQARTQALQMAYAEAVGRGCGVDIGSLMVVRNVRHVSDIVTARSRGFVRAYTVIGEGVSPNDSTRYEIRIDAEVIADGTGTQDEKEGLRLYLGLLGDPVLLIMLPEKSESASAAESDPGSTLRGTEAALAQAFSAYGYQVITSDDLLSGGQIESQVLTEARRGITAQALKAARAANADIALLGNMKLSTRSVKPAGVDLFLTTAEASAKALIVSNGKTIQAFHQSKRASSPDALAAYADCLDRVAVEMADVMAWKIPQILNQDSRKTRLVIHGIDMDKTNAVKHSIGEMTGVEMVQISKLPTSDQNFSELLVFTGFLRISNGDVFDICQKTLGTSMTVVNENKYEIELKKK